MNLKELREFCNQKDYVKEIVKVIENYHRELKGKQRKPKFFSVMMTGKDKIWISDRFLDKDPTGHCRVFVGKRLPDNFFDVDYNLINNTIRNKVSAYFLYTGIQLCISEPIEKLPLLISEELFRFKSITQSRLGNVELWKMLEPIFSFHNNNNICQLQYATEMVDIYLNPYVVISQNLGMVDYDVCYKYMPACEGLIPHLGKGFYFK